MTVKARAALRKGSRIGSACQALCYSSFTLFGNRDRWSVNEASTIEQFLSLREDVSLLALGSYFGEALEALSDEDRPDPRLLRLGLNSLYALSRRLYSPEHIKCVFELRLLCLSGYAPDLSRCAVCYRENPRQPFFSLSGGCIHCADCAPDTDGPSIAFDESLRDAIGYISQADDKRIFSFRLPPDEENRLSSLAERYFLTQLDRSFATLDYYKSL